jgi:hypothetical protein
VGGFVYEWREGFAYFLGTAAIFTFVIMGTVVVVFVNTLLGALLSGLPLLFVAYSPTTRSIPATRTLREDPLVLLVSIVGFAGFVMIIGAGAVLDLPFILIGLALFLICLAVLAPRLRRAQLAQLGPQFQEQPSAVPPAVYGSAPTAPPYPAYPPSALFPPPTTASLPTPPAPPPPAAPVAPFCTSCGQPTLCIAQYDRYYCYSCARYAASGPPDNPLLPGGGRMVQAH